MANNNTTAAAWLMSAEPIGIAYLQAPNNTGIVAIVIRRSNASMIEVRTLSVQKGSIVEDATISESVAGDGEAARAGTEAWLTGQSKQRPDWGNWVTGFVGNDGELAALISHWQKVTATGRQMTASAGNASSGGISGLLISGAAIAIILLLRRR